MTEPGQGQPLHEGDAVRMTVVITGTVTSDGKVHVPGVVEDADLLWLEELCATCTVLKRNERGAVVHAYVHRPLRLPGGASIVQAGAAEESKGV